MPSKKTKSQAETPRKVKTSLPLSTFGVDDEPNDASDDELPEITSVSLKKGGRGLSKRRGRGAKPRGNCLMRGSGRKDLRKKDSSPANNYYDQSTDQEIKSSSDENAPAISRSESFDHIFSAMKMKDRKEKGSKRQEDTALKHQAVTHHDHRSYHAADAPHAVNRGSAPEQPKNARQWTAFVGYCYRYTRFYIYHKKDIIMESSELDIWWETNIETNNPDRLKMHKLKLKKEMPERVQIFSRIEDKVDDKRVKAIIHHKLEPTFLRILSSYDEEVEADEALAQLIDIFHWQIVDGFTYDELPRKPLRKTGRGAPHAPEETDQSATKSRRLIGEKQQDGGILYTNAGGSDTKSETSGDENLDAERIGTEIDLPPCDVSSQQLILDMTNLLDTGVPNETVSSDMFLDCHEHEVTDETAYQIFIQPKKQNKTGSEEVSKESEESETHKLSSPNLMVPPKQNDGIASLSEQFAQGIGASIERKEKDPAEELDDESPLASSEGPYRIDRLYALPTSLFPGTRYGTIMSQRESQRWEEFKSKTGNDTHEYARVTAEHLHYLPKIFSRLIRLQNEVTQVHRRQQFIEECLIKLLQKGTTDHATGSNVHSLRPEQSSRFPFEKRIEAETFFKAAKESPELFDEVAKHLLWVIQEARQGKALLKMGHWAKLLLKSLFSIELLRDSTWGFIKSTTHRSPLPKPFTEWYFTVFERNFLASEFWYIPSEFNEKVTSFFGNIRLKPSKTKKNSDARGGECSKFTDQI